jgi:hypothetical protein
MNLTRIVANRIIDQVLANAEVEALGYFAAVAEVAAEDYGNSIGERRQLLERAERYRALQILAMERL